MYHFSRNQWFPSVAIGLLLLTPLTQAADWPQWMGPNLDGVSTEAGWSVDWPDSGLPVVWESQIGIGFTSISIVDGLLYTMGHRDGEETVWCLDAATGRKVWTQSYAAELNNHLYEGGPGATPTVHGDSVFTLGVDGRLLALQCESGKVLWEQALQKTLSVEMHEWGFNSSPLIIGNKLIIEAGRLAAFDRRTGDLIWQSEEHRAGYGSVRAFGRGDQTLLASLDCDGLRISNAFDGQEVAFTKWPSPFRTNSTTPIIANDRIWISTGYNVGCGLFGLKGDQLEAVYANKKMRNHFNNSILFEGHLYGFDGNSNLGRVVTLTCMEFATGQVKWKERGLGCGSLMIADGKLIVLSEKGDLLVAPANPDRFEVLSRSSLLDGRCWTVPVLLNGHIYGRNAAGRLVCVKLP